MFQNTMIMWPTFQQINTEAIQPLDKGEITTEEAFTIAQGPIREFMYGETLDKDLKLFVDISDKTYDSYVDVPMTTLIPAFILSELRAAFIIGFVIYIPFIVIDMGNAGRTHTGRRRKDVLKRNKVKNAYCGFVGNVGTP